MDKSLQEIFKDTETVAIIGCSSNEYRTSNHIARYLKEEDFRIIPIHPDYDEVLGEKVYESILDLPEDVKVDIVDIFRNSRYTAEMVEEIVRWSNETGQKPVIWTQLGVSSDEARRKAEEAGLPYVEDRCIMVEHRNR